MQRHSTFASRQPEFGIRHSLLVTRHSLLCIAFAALLAANARAAEVANFVEYFETDGINDYILLDYTPTSNSVIEADIAILDITKTHTVFCSRSTGNSRTFTCFYVGNTGFRWDYNTTQTSTGKKLSEDGERHTIRCASTGFYFDGDLVKPSTPGNFIPGNRMTLFASYNNQTAPTLPTPSDNFSKMRLYSFKAWDDDGATLKVDLRPVVDTKDQPALLNLVTGTLHHKPIPRTLQKNTDYVVNCATGAAPSQIFVENASLTIADRSYLDFYDTRSAAQTNFFLHVTGGSVATNISWQLPLYPTSRVVVDGGSLVHAGTVRESFYVGQYVNLPGAVLAVTNATLLCKNSGNGTFKVLGDGNTLSFCNSRIDGGSSLEFRAKNSRVSFAGDCGGTKFTLAFGPCTNCWFVLEDNARLALTNGYLQLNNKTGSRHGILVGRNAYLRTTLRGLCNWGDYETISNGLFQVEEGGQLIVHVGLQDSSINGNSRWVINNGQFVCDSDYLQIGTRAKHTGTRLELNGDNARVIDSSIGFQIGNTDNPRGCTIALKPGPNAFYGEGPIAATNETRGVVWFLGACVFEIDAREPLRRCAANQVLRIPVVQAGHGFSSWSSDKLDALNELLVTYPEGGKLVKDGKFLYCEIKRRATTVLSLR